MNRRIDEGDGTRSSEVQEETSATEILKASLRTIWDIIQQFASRCGKALGRESAAYDAGAAPINHVPATYGVPAEQPYGHFGRSRGWMPVGDKEGRERGGRSEWSAFFG